MKYKAGDIAYQDMNLLISILLRYPEAVSVRYIPQDNALDFVFLFDIQDNTSQDILDILPQALAVYHHLEQREMRLCQVEIQSEEGIGKFVVRRDVESITKNEVGLIVEMVKGAFGFSMIYEEAELPEDERLYQEEMIGYVLESMRNAEIDKNFIALREEGKVMLFHS
ncbi:MAG: hypothetical protein LBT32_04655 [Peptococcaceae bacterium]|jgi:hypothetical protein|nr:hypothetical protein [Peptococcaceae bacterium]